jgi:hypothetical protein
MLSLLIATTLIALLVARYSVPALRQREAVANITALGGEVYSDWGLAGKTSPPGPAWLRGLIGDDLFQRVTSVSLTDNKFDAPEVLHAALVQVARMPTVTFLYASSKEGLDDASMQEIAKLQSLQALYLVGVNTKLSEAGLSPLARLSNLTSLDLRGPSVDVGLKDLSKLDKLAELTIGNVTDKTLEQIACLGQLLRLTLRGEISADAITLLEPLIELQTLAYNKGRATEALDVPIIYGYTDSTVIDVIAYLHQKTDVAFRIDKEAISREKLRIDTEVYSDSASGISFRQTLDRLLVPAGLGFRVEKNELVITTREEADRARSGIRALQKKLPKLKVTIGW